MIWAERIGRWAVGSFPSWAGLAGSLTIVARSRSLVFRDGFTETVCCRFAAVVRRSGEPELACSFRTMRDLQLASPSHFDDIEEGALGIQTIRTDKGEELVVMSRRDYDALLARAGDDEAQDRMSVQLATEARPDQHLPHSVSAAISDGASGSRPSNG